MSNPRRRAKEKFRSNNFPWRHRLKLWKISRKVAFNWFTLPLPPLSLVLPCRCVGVAGEQCGEFSHQSVETNKSTSASLKTPKVNWSPQQKLPHSPLSLFSLPWHADITAKRSASHHQKLRLPTCGRKGGKGAGGKIARESSLSGNASRKRQLETVSKSPRYASDRRTHDDALHSLARPL